MFYNQDMHKGKYRDLFFLTSRSQSLLGVMIFVLFSLITYSSKILAISLIVNNSVIETPSSTQAIRNIFTLQRKYWSNGSKIKIFVFADDNPLHQQFCKQVTHIFPHQYRRIWDRLQFSGTGVAPTTVKSREEMLDSIAKTKNSIGYIDSGTNAENNHIQVRIIKLDSIDGVSK
jgi:ABC-type phosphate transport system substrate-binding protein